MKAIFWNDVERRLRAFWRLFLHGLAFFLSTGCFLVVPSVLLFLRTFSLTVIPETAEVVDWVMRSPAFLLLNGIAGVVAILLSTGLAGRFLDRRPFLDFGFHIDRAWWIDFGFGLGLGGILMALIFGVEWALGWIHIEATFETALPNWRFLVAWVAYGISFLCVGIYEELWFRGYILRNLAEGLNFSALGPRWALLIAWFLSSSIFGVFHLGNPGATFVSTFNIALAGIFLGIGYVLTGELAVPMGLHITWNFFQGNVFGFPVSGIPSTTSVIAITQGGPDLWTGGAFGPEAGLLGILAMATGVLLTLAWVRYRYGRVTVRTSLAVYERPQVE